MTTLHAAGDAGRLSDRRRQLAGAIAAVNEIRARHERTIEPALRLAPQRRAAEAALKDVEALRSADDAALAEWLASPCPTTPRPEPNPELLTAEGRARAAEREGRAAGAAIAQAETAAAEIAASMHTIIEMRDEAMIAVVREEAALIGDELLTACNAACRVEAKLVALKAALDLFARDRNTRPPVTSAALGACETLETIRRSAREKAAAQADTDAARWYIDNLRSDANATYRR